jgi:hypothetical protein
MQTIMMDNATNIPVPIDGNFVVIVASIGIKIAALENDLSSGNSGNFFQTFYGSGLSDPSQLTIPWDENTMWIRQDSGGPAVISYYSY